jgi:hypothetical protein
MAHGNQKLTIELDLTNDDIKVADIVRAVQEVAEELARKILVPSKQGRENTYVNEEGTITGYWAATI